MFVTKGQKWFECHGWDNDVPKIFYSHKKDNSIHDSVQYFLNNEIGKTE